MQSIRRRRGEARRGEAMAMATGNEWIAIARIHIDRQSTRAETESSQAQEARGEQYTNTGHLRKSTTISLLSMHDDEQAERSQHNVLCKKHKTVGIFSQYIICKINNTEY